MDRARPSRAGAHVARTRRAAISNESGAGRHDNHPGVRHHRAVVTPTSMKPTNPNRYAFITFGIVALYIVLAIATHFVLIGILPLGMSLRSRAAREPLAPVAIAAAVISIVIAIATLTHH